MKNLKEFGSGRDLNDVIFLCLSVTIKMTTKLSVRSLTVPIELKKRELPNASRGSYRLSQWSRFCVVNYPTFRHARFPATPIAVHQYLSLVRQNKKIKPSPYRAVNTLRLGCKNQAVNAV